MKIHPSPIYNIWDIINDKHWTVRFHTSELINTVSCKHASNSGDEDRNESVEKWKIICWIIWTRLRQQQLVNRELKIVFYEHVFFILMFLFLYCFLIFDGCRMQDPFLGPRQFLVTKDHFKKRWKMFFISYQKLILLSRYFNFCPDFLTIK